MFCSGKTTLLSYYAMGAGCAITIDDTSPFSEINLFLLTESGVMWSLKEQSLMCPLAYDRAAACFMRCFM